jgi:hypothetical protein
MTSVAGRYLSALLLACAGLAISSCLNDAHDPSAAAAQLATEATHRVCGILETCCRDANFPYQEQGCMAFHEPRLLQYFNEQVFLGAELDTEAAKRCLDSIGQVSDGCPLERAVDGLTEACEWLFKGTVPLGGECDRSHGCATTRAAPLLCERAYDPRSERFESSGVCVENPALAVVHKNLGDACSSTCMGDLCWGSESDDTCYTSDGLVCSWQSNKCELQGVGGEPCQGTGDCVSGMYCEFADFKCAPTRPIGDPCTEQEQCDSQYCAGSCAHRPRASADSCLGKNTLPVGQPGTGGRAPD